MTVTDELSDDLFDGYEPPGEPSTNGHTIVDDDLRAMLLDWPAFWSGDREEEEWLAEPLIPAKRSVAIFAPGGTGKSLLALWLAAALATGREIFGRKNRPISVLYLDYEMTEDDLHERLANMGYGPDEDLSRLHYALLPSLPALDGKDGGKAVVRLAQLCEAELVVIDTFGRAVHGDENDADTVRNWYRWTGIHLKAEGRAFARVDHAGKDLERGQRGTSGKNDDVDVVWQLTRQDGDTFKLIAKKRRMSWVPESVQVALDETDGLTYKLLAGGGWPAGTAECAHHLERLGVALGEPYRTAAKVLTESGCGTRGAIVRAALKYRRQQADAALGGTEMEPLVASRHSGRTRDAPMRPDVADAPGRNPLNPQLDDASQDSGRTGTHGPGVVRPKCASPIGDALGDARQTGRDDDPDCPF